MNANDWGARIERGEITESKGTMHKVKSLDREGITTPYLGVLEIDPKIKINVAHDQYDAMVNETLEAEYTPTEYAMGDMVYFFMFADGHGAILGKAK